MISGDLALAVGGCGMCSMQCCFSCWLQVPETMDPGDHFDISVLVCGPAHP